MDFAFLGCIAALWAAVALLVVGFEKLEKPVGARS